MSRHSRLAGRRAAFLSVLTALALGAGCSDSGQGPLSENAPPIAAMGLGIKFEEGRRPPDLDVPQLTGSETVDYIIDSIGSGAAWLDYDGDGDPDLYLAQGAGRDGEGPPDRLLRNEGGPGFPPKLVDVTAQAGLGDRRHSFGVAVADYDNDGDPDIYLTNQGPNRLYRNEGNGTFTDIAHEAGVDHPGWGTSAAWADVDRDGDLDLYVANYVVFDYGRYPARGETSKGGAPCVWKGIEVFCGPRNLEAAANVFYRNDGDADGDGIPRFVEATDAAGLRDDPPLYSLAVHFFDADDDGDDDLYVANDSVRNNFFVNDGSGRFEDRSILAGVAYNEQGNEQAGMGITSGDYDEDGRVDLLVSNFSHDHDTVYHNVGDGMFRDVSYPAGLGSPSFLTLGWGIELLDLDQDTWLDLFVAQGHVYPQVDGQELGTSFRELNRVYRNRRDGTFEDVSQGAGSGLAIRKSSRCTLPVDLDGDGDLDLLVTNLNDTVDLLRNESATGNWLQVRLEGRRSNRDGIGAKVTLETEGKTQTREVRRATSYAGSTLPVAHFGLRLARRVDRLEVRWPSGAVTTQERVPVNQLVTIREE